MKTLLSGATAFFQKSFVKTDVLIDSGVIVRISPFISHDEADMVFSFSDRFIFPGLVDVHVHLREPGFFYKETIRTGSLAAAHGGITHICAMPNLSPAPDNLSHLNIEREIIARDAAVHVYPYGTITIGEHGEALSDMESLAPYVCAFSDDGRGVQDPELMRTAMLRAKALDRLIVAHCEDNTLLHGGYIHNGAYAKQHGHRGISSESEWRQIERDLALVRETGCGYHICHISTKESVELIRQAKAQGLDVTCETAPHYLLLDDSMMQEDGRFKMNPPLRSPADREALISGIIDGTIDMIATDHAPHSAEEKSRGLEGSVMGVVGLESSFALLYTGLVRTGVISPERLLELMHDTPSKRFRIGSQLSEGATADLAVFDLDTPYKIDPSAFLSMGRSTPFEGADVYGRCILTMTKGRTVWQEKV